jgi:peptide/nickel transport system permease protein
MALPYEFVGDPTPPLEEVRESSDRSTFRQAFFENKLAVIGVALLIFIVLFCFIGPLIYRTNQVSGNILIANEAPSLKHLLGVDENGYDQLGRLMVAGQASLEIGVAAAILGTLFGVIYGAISGYFGGLLDGLMMRVVDGALAIPSLLLLIVLASLITPSVPLLILIVSALAWFVPARLVRAEGLSLRSREYVEAARIVGSRSPRIIIRHIIPNTVGTIVVNATFQVADAIVLVAYLSFLGFGVPPPATNWGAMLSSGLDYIIAGEWWLIYAPGVAIILTVVAFNFIGEGLRDAFEVRSRSR